MAAYYNENDPFAAAWVRELIKAGLIADGEVDERSIADVAADDVRGFVQCHFFAGIGGWSYALRLAGWPDDRAVWTGSCPCQPFSSAGAQAGGHDPRDLWPTWFQFVKECRPVVVFGEQVEAAIGHGWLDRLCDDLEAEDYAVGAVGIPAAGVGAFHIRQRLWFVADAESGGQPIHGSTLRQARHVDEREQDGGLANAARRDQQRYGGEPRSASGACGREAWPSDGHAAGSAGALGDTDGARFGWADESRSARLRHAVERPCGAGWTAVDWLACADGKSRPVEPGTFPLAHGVSGRVAVRLPVESATAAIQEHWYNRTGALKGFGNAIVPQVAQVFIEAYMDARGI